VCFSNFNKLVMKAVQAFSPKSCFPKPLTDHNAIGKDFILELPEAAKCAKKYNPDSMCDVTNILHEHLLHCFGF